MHEGIHDGHGGYTMDMRGGGSYMVSTDTAMVLYLGFGRRGMNGSGSGNGVVEDTLIFTLLLIHVLTHSCHLMIEMCL